MKLWHEANICCCRSVTSALSFVMQHLIHCPLGKTSGTLVLTINNNFGESLQSRNLDFWNWSQSTKACGLMIELVWSTLLLNLRLSHGMRNYKLLLTFADCFFEWVTNHYSMYYSSKMHLVKLCTFNVKLTAVYCLTYLIIFITTLTRLFWN